MDSFYLIVLGVATLVLIMMLAFLGWTMSQTKKGDNYPQIVKTCPDNWTVNSTIVPGKIVCERPQINEANYGKDSLGDYMRNAASVGYVAGNTGHLNFTNDLWSSNTETPNPNCAKRKWASTYEIKWDSLESANYCE